MTDTEDEAVADRAMTALRRVIDPELGYNIVDLGLIYRVEVADGAVQAIMATTTPGCPATVYLRGGANQALGSAVCVTTVAWELTCDPPWTPETMSDGAKAHLGISDDGW